MVQLHADHGQQIEMGPVGSDFATGDGPDAEADGLEGEVAEAPSAMAPEPPGPPSGGPPPSPKLPP